MRTPPARREAGAVCWALTGSNHRCPTPQASCLLRASCACLTSWWPRVSWDVGLRPHALALQTCVLSCDRPMPSRFLTPPHSLPPPTGNAVWLDAQKQQCLVLWRKVRQPAASAAQPVLLGLCRKPTACRHTRIQKATLTPHCPRLRSGRRPSWGGRPRTVCRTLSCCWRTCARGTTCAAQVGAERCLAACGRSSAAQRAAAGSLLGRAPHVCTPPPRCQTCTACTARCCCARSSCWRGRGKSSEAVAQAAASVGVDQPAACQA